MQEARYTVDELELAIIDRGVKSVIVVSSAQPSRSDQDDQWGFIEELLEDFKDLSIRVLLPRNHLNDLPRHAQERRSGWDINNIEWVCCDYSTEKESRGCEVAGRRAEAADESASSRSSKTKKSEASRAAPKNGRSKRKHRGSKEEAADESASSKSLKRKKSEASRAAPKNGRSKRKNRGSKEEAADQSASSTPTKKKKEEVLKASRTSKSRSTKVKCQGPNAAAPDQPVSGKTAKRRRSETSADSTDSKRQRSQPPAHGSGGQLSSSGTDSERPGSSITRTTLNSPAPLSPRSDASSSSSPWREYGGFRPPNEDITSSTPPSSSTSDAPRRKSCDNASAAVVRRPGSEQSLDATTSRREVKRGKRTLLSPTSEVLSIPSPWREYGGFIPPDEHVALHAPLPSTSDGSFHDGEGGDRSNLHLPREEQFADASREGEQPRPRRPGSHGQQH